MADSANSPSNSEYDRSITSKWNNYNLKKKQQNKLIYYKHFLGISHHQQQNSSTSSSSSSTIYKPSDAKIRRIQTPTQYSTQTHYSVTQGTTGNQGNQPKMRPDSYGKYLHRIR